jgi:sulfur-oxidizing protein SoxA
MARRWLLLGLLVAVSAARGEAVEPAVDTAAAPPVSGYDWLSSANQKLQDDDFANPGLLWVSLGERLFAADCVRCHAVDRISDVRLRYPAFDVATGKLGNLEQRINQCRTGQMDKPAYDWESAPLLALTAYLASLARGQTILVAPDARARPFLEAGAAFFRQRRGQLDLACGHCHVQHAGRQLRGERISEGHINGYPAYRHVWETLGSSHRLFRWCNEAVRAEPFAYGADEYVNLEYYLNWRGNGLQVEAPAVRR